MDSTLVDTSLTSTDISSADIIDLSVTNTDFLPESERASTPPPQPPADLLHHRHSRHAVASSPYRTSASSKPSSLPRHASTVPSSTSTYHRQPEVVVPKDLTQFRSTAVETVEGMIKRRTQQEGEILYPSLSWFCFFVMKTSSSCYGTAGAV